MNDGQLIDFLRGMEQETLPPCGVYRLCISLASLLTGQDENVCRELYGNYTAGQWLMLLSETTEAA